MKKDIDHNTFARNVVVLESRLGPGAKGRRAPRLGGSNPPTRHPPALALGPIGYWLGRISFKNQERDRYPLGSP